MEFCRFEFLSIVRNVRTEITSDQSTDRHDYARILKVTGEKEGEEEGEKSSDRPRERGGREGKTAAAALSRKFSLRETRLIKVGTREVP